VTKRESKQRHLVATACSTLLPVAALLTGTSVARAPESSQWRLCIRLLLLLGLLFGERLRRRRCEIAGGSQRDRRQKSQAIAALSHLSTGAGGRRMINSDRVLSGAVDDLASLGILWILYSLRAHRAVQDARHAYAIRFPPRQISCMTRLRIHGGIRTLRVCGCTAVLQLLGQKTNTIILVGAHGGRAVRGDPSSTRLQVL
jgi:hypothetical protein